MKRLCAFAVIVALSLAFSHDFLYAETSEELDFSGITMGKRFTLDLSNITIKQFAELMSKITGEEITLSDDIDINSRADIFTDEPITVEQAREILRKFLENSSYSRRKPNVTSVLSRFVYSNIILADSNGKEGTISSGNLDYFMRNILHELTVLTRIRLNRNKAGIEVQWLQNDSFLRRIGIQRGDVLCSINGITLSGADSIADIISSLKKHERFDFGLNRKGKNISLLYSVR